LNEAGVRKHSAAPHLGKSGKKKKGNGGTPLGGYLGISEFKLEKPHPQTRTTVKEER